MSRNLFNCIRDDDGKIQLQFIVMDVVDHHLVHNEGRLERQRRVRQVTSKDVTLRRIDKILSRRTVSENMCNHRVERKKGLEPSTSSLATKCSTIELLPQIV